MTLSHLDTLGQVELGHHVGNLPGSGCQTSVCGTHLNHTHNDVMLNHIKTLNYIRGRGHKLRMDWLTKKKKLSR